MTIIRIRKQIINFFLFINKHVILQVNTCILFNTKTKGGIFRDIYELFQFDDFLNAKHLNDKIKIMIFFVHKEEKKLTKNIIPLLIVHIVSKFKHLNKL